MTLKRKKIISAVILSTIMLIGVFGSIGFVNATHVPGHSAEGDAPNNNETSNNNDDKTEKSLANIISWVLFYIATFFSWLVSLLVWVMIYVANYNHFLDMPIVINGWSIVRDVANNFFIVILLVIAVGTILRVPNYNRQLLPKLLVMAVLINFSKMFTGILIDFSQILTLWFAEAIQRGGGDSGAIILVALGLGKLYELTKYSSTTNLGWTDAPIQGLEPVDAVRTLLFAFILSVIAVVVVAMITIILVYRIVMLWFLVILSPLAFLLTTFPKGQQYAGMWWGELSRYLVVGPVMLFFLYLSIFSGSIADIRNPSGVQSNVQKPADLQGIDQNGSLGVNDITSGPDGLFNFLIIIGLMVGSLVAGQKTGVAGSKFAGDGVANLRKWGKKATVGAGTAAAGFAGAQALRAGMAIPGARRVPILGRMAGQAVDKRQLRLASANAKVEQERITTRAQALKVDGKSEVELRKLALGGDKYARIAATQSMMKQGMFRDDDVTNRATNIKLINDAKKMLPPELAATFMDNTKKYNPGLAHDTVYKDDKGEFRTDAFVSDVRTGKVKAHEMMQALTKSQVGALNTSLTKGGHGNIAEFLLNNVSEKDLGEMNGSLLDEVRDEIWKGNINHKTWEKKLNTVTGKEEITDAGKKMRDKFNKITNFNNVMQTFDETNDHDVESIRNFVSSNGSDIGKKMKNVSEEFVRSFGDLINPSQFKDQAPAIKKKLSDSFEAVINKITEGDIAGGDKMKYQKIFKNALTSGSSFEESKIDATVDKSGRLVNKERRDILQSVMSTTTVKEAENMRGLNRSNSQMQMAGTHMNVNVIKGLSVSQDGSVMASKIAAEVKKQAVGKGASSPEAQRADKLKDI